jgi:hypothetical protein
MSALRCLQEGTGQKKLEADGRLEIFEEKEAIRPAHFDGSGMLSLPHDSSDDFEH